MSRWLSSVNSLLEKLDDRVETVVEERVLAQEEYEEEYEADGVDRNNGKTVLDEEGNKSLDDILAKRGIFLVESDNDDDDDEGEEEKDDNQYGGNVVKDDEDHGSRTEAKVNEAKDSGLSSLEVPSRNIIESTDTSAELEILTTNASQQQSDASVDVERGKDDVDGHATEEEPFIRKDNQNAVEETSTGNGINSMVVPPSTPPRHSSATFLLSNTSSPTKKIPSTLSSPSRSIQEGTPTSTITRMQRRERELNLEIKEAQKEARTLRRYIVALNEQLEAAESELQAQRKELVRAAERMEKDRIRNKEERENSKKQQAQESALLKSQHEKTLKEQQMRFEDQLEGYRKRLQEEENKRKQEGGDWNKELAQAIDREQEMRQVVSELMEEKAILLSQISTLQGQQTALGSRLESLTQAADNAIAREREAEDRLDSVLTQHARQISQRQAREAELERTVQELNTALVASRDKILGLGRLSSTDSASGTNDGNGVISSSDARIQALQMDLEVAQSHLALERERSETLQMQLRELSKETTQEAAMIHQKQIQSERQIAEMSLTISKLEARLREAEKSISVETSSSSSERVAQDEEIMVRQMKQLSEEVLRLRDKVASHNSESLAMKHRLKSAVDKANRLEDELASTRNSASVDGDVYDSMERAQATSSMRRRPGAANNGSIRAAMFLDDSGGERAKQLGQVVDAVDSFAVITGRYLRRNPLARAGFILYLVLIHLWSFVILFFHAHSFQEHGDFGTGVGVPHGPHAMMTHKQPMNAIVNADISGVTPTLKNSKEQEKGLNAFPETIDLGIGNSNNGNDIDQRHPNPDAE